ncbi:MAG: polysaccharide deacetylase family protein [Planctomycetes bacterium]|nr:polysaccharide deacetylase family protein [Planctomycetota bacterium]
MPSTRPIGTPFAPPSAADRAQVAVADRPGLLVVVDTEEEFDWSAGFDRKNTSVEHMREIGLLQAVFDEARVVPLYVVDYPIATQATSLAPLREFLASGRCEIGAHLHPWVSPPFEEEVNAHNSYPGNLPPALERAKLAQLVDAIEKGFGVRPRAYKAGRYGAGPETPRILGELGLDIDISPCPPFDLSGDGGPDWSSFPCEPFWIGERKNVLSIPNTGAYVGFVKDGAHGLYRLANSAALRWARAGGILSRIGAVERLFLSPEGYSFQDLRRLTLSLRERGVAHFTFSLHSPSIRPGCTSYVTSLADREKFLDTCRRYFEFFAGEIGGVATTATELHARATANKGTKHA